MITVWFDFWIFNKLQAQKQNRHYLPCFVCRWSRIFIYISFCRISSDGVKKSGLCCRASMEMSFGTCHPCPFLKKRQWSWFNAVRKQINILKVAKSKFYYMKWQHVRGFSGRIKLLYYRCYKLLIFEQSSIEGTVTVQCL